MGDEVRWLEEVEEQVWRDLQLMTMQLNAVLNRQLARDSKLSVADYAVLVALTAQPQELIRANELGRWLGWEKSRLSHHIARMQQRGLVERQECEIDGRGAFVVLTKQGRETIEAAAPGHVEAVRANFIDLLSPTQLEALGSITKTVLDGLSRDGCPSEEDLSD